jgi:hypothetical protein
MTIKDECANSMVETIMEGVTLISIQLKTIIVPITTTPGPSAITEDLGVDVKIEVTKATIMEK